MKQQGRYITAALVGAFAGGTFVKKLWREKYKQQRTELLSFQQEADLLYTWLSLVQTNRKLTEYFLAHNFCKVAVFGMTRVGRLAVEALGDMVVYGVEGENLGVAHERLTVYRLRDDPLPPADCMLICTKWDEEAETNVRAEYSGEIVSLEEVLRWLSDIEVQ